ncbi:imm11 family protein [Bradyrhizobium liaoningense]|uniref:imm11 family protein n=1 Tax=Bradyrhizobium liaoningense TaxID=43992 RepID=UPI001FE59E4A|nr:DUF1629 domain-containing protein [Bradyrhizobium liaoningense]
MPLGWRVEGKPDYWLEDKSILPPHEVFRLPASTARAPIVFDKSVSDLPYDLEPYDRLDPEALVFVPCDVRLPRGSYDGPDYRLCDVVRVLDALDESQSRLKIGIRDDVRYLDHGKKYYDVGLGSKLVFREATIGKAHVFRMAYSETAVICDQDLKDACKSAGSQENLV